MKNEEVGKKLTLEQVKGALDEPNATFGTDYRLKGSWKEKGHSDNDIDLYSESDSYKRAEEVGFYIASRTNMVVEFHPIQWRMYHNDMNNHVLHVIPDGRYGSVMEFINDTEYLDKMLNYTKQTRQLTTDQIDGINKGILIVWGDKE